MLAESEQLTGTADELTVALTCRRVHNPSVLNKVQLGFAELDPPEWIYKRPTSSQKRCRTLYEKRTDETPSAFVHRYMEYGFRFGFCLNKSPSVSLSLSPLLSLFIHVYAIPLIRFQ